MRVGIESRDEAQAWAAAEILRRALLAGPYRSTVTTGSMGPLARAGDVFVIEAPGRRFRFGDVVAAPARGRAVIHRVVGRRGGFLLLKGDASPRPDPPVRPADVPGYVRALEKKNGRVIRFDTPWARLVGAALAALSRLEGTVTDACYPPPLLARKVFYLSSRALCLLLGA
ncbi:MAG: hypothetical protein PVH29_01660 [Candidatus Zixiibacteriota bacterium]